MRLPRKVDESGVVLVLVAVAMVVFLVAAALVVDLGGAYQQDRQAQAVADTGALSAASGLTDATADPYSVGFDYAFKSLSLTPPSSTQMGPCSPASSGCQSYTTDGKSVSITTPWLGHANWVNVRACWSTATTFARVIGQRSLPFCASATAENTGVTGGGSGGDVGAGCSPNELQDVSTLTPPSPGQTVAAGSTISATYVDNNSPLDKSSIVFIAPNASGQMVTLSAPGQGSGPSYQLTDNAPSQPGTNVTISYTIPSGLYTATGSLFVADSSGQGCGLAAWTTCDTAEDPFFEHNGQLDSDDGSMGDISGDSDDAVSPAPGQAVYPGQTLSDTYTDETQLDPDRVLLSLDGTPEQVTFSPPPPADPATGTADYGTVSASVSTLGKPPPPPPGGSPAPPPASGTAALTVTLEDYLGDPIAGKTVTLSHTGDHSTFTPTMATTGADGTATFTISDSSSETATYSVRDTTDNVALTSTAAIAFPKGSITVSGGGARTQWTSSKSSGSYQVTSGYTLPSSLSNGWHSAFGYAFDTDQNKAGGDCALAQWAFTSTGGSPGNGSISLVQ